MRKVLRGLSHLSNWVSLIPIIAFLVMAVIMPHNTLAIIINSLDIGAWLLIVRAYLPPFWRKLRSSERDSPDVYFLGGVLLSSTALALSRLWSLGIILAGKPPWMLNHWFQSFCYMLVALSFYYFLRVPGSAVSARYIGYAVAAAAAIGVITLIFVEA